MTIHRLQEFTNSQSNQRIKSKLFLHTSKYVLTNINIQIILQVTLKYNVGIGAELRISRSHSASHCIGSNIIELQGRLYAYSLVCVVENTCSFVCDC